MLDLTHRQGKAHPNHNERAPPVRWNGEPQNHERWRQRRCGERVARALLVGVGAGAATVEDGRELPPKLKNRSTCDPAAPPL